MSGPWDMAMSPCGRTDCVALRVGPDKMSALAVVPTVTVNRLVRA
jgi:hypothetical protein